MASAVTTVQVTQLPFRSICRQLLLRSARPGQPLPHLPSQKSSLLPDLGVPCVRVSSLCLLIHLPPASPSWWKTSHPCVMPMMKSHYCALVPSTGPPWGKNMNEPYSHYFFRPQLCLSYPEENEVTDILPKCTHQKWEDSPWSPHRSRWLCVSGESPSFTPSLTRLCSYFSGECSLLGQLYMVLGIFLKAKKAASLLSPRCSR